MHLITEIAFMLKNETNKTHTRTNEQALHEPVTTL